MCQHPRFQINSIKKMNEKIIKIAYYPKKIKHPVTLIKRNHIPISYEGRQWTSDGALMELCWVSFGGPGCDQTYDDLKRLTLSGRTFVSWSSKECLRDCSVWMREWMNLMCRILVFILIFFFFVILCLDIWWLPSLREACHLFDGSQVTV